MKKLILLSVMVLTLSGCSKGFQNLAGSSSEPQQNQGEGTPPPSESNGWEKVEFSGYQANGTSSNTLVIHIDKANQSLIFVLPIPMIIPIIAPLEIPKLPGAYLTSYTDPNGGGDSLAVSIPLHYIVRNGVFMPNQKLPSGEDLPYVPAGELPGFAIEFPQMPSYQIHLYIGTNIAAVFAELPKLGLPFNLIFPVKNLTKTKVIGAVGYVTPKGSYPGGIYLAAQLPADLARVIDELLRW